MRERLQDWAPYFGGLGIAFWVAAAVLRLLGRPDELLIVLLAVGLVFFVLFVYLRPSSIRQVVTSRGARYGSNALVVSILVIAIVGLLNYLGTWPNFHYRQDVTANKSFSLSPLTIKVLKDLKEPVRATAFFSTRQNRQDVEDRLKEYSLQSDKFTYRFVDPDVDPATARDYKIPDYGTVVMERGTRREIAPQTDEQGLTNSIVKVTQDTQPAIYFTTGHGEHSPDDTGNNGLSMAKTGLESSNYKVATIDLKTLTDTLPSDISALIIAGPRQPFQPAEAKIVSDYLSKNGRVLMMLDPQTDTGLDGVLKDWGLKLDNDVVYDPKFGISGQSQVPLINTYPNHPVTQDLNGISSLFPLARSLQAATPPAGISPTALLTTSDQSWGETDLDSVKNQTAKYDSGADIKGPLNIAYAVEGQGGTNPTRLVVIGNSSFLSNGTVTARLTVAGQLTDTGNWYLFGNSLRWLAGQENLIAIPAKSADTHPVLLNGGQQNFILLSSAGLLPLAILIIGALVWWRRR